MTAVVFVPLGGLAVLDAVAAGRSPWHGWDAGVFAKTPEGQEAYAVRARLITACRRAGLLTEENVLTAEGRTALAATMAGGRP